MEKGSLLPSRFVMYSSLSIVSLLHFVRWVGGGFGRVRGKGQAVPAADLPLFHPKAPDPRTTAGLLARSGLHAFPARGAPVALSCGFTGTYSYGDSS